MVPVHPFAQKSINPSPRALHNAPSAKPPAAPNSSGPTDL
jgi:hypothetical protein